MCVCVCVRVCVCVFIVFTKLHADNMSKKLLINDNEHKLNVGVTRHYLQCKEHAFGSARHKASGGKDRDGFMRFTA